MALKKVRLLVSLSIIFWGAQSFAQPTPIKPPTGWQPVGTAIGSPRGHANNATVSYSWFVNREPADKVLLCRFVTSTDASACNIHDLTAYPGTWFSAGVSAGGFGDAGTLSTLWLTSGTQMLLCIGNSAAPTIGCRTIAAPAP